MSIESEPPSQEPEPEKPSQETPKEKHWLEQRYDEALERAKGKGIKDADNFLELTIILDKGERKGVHEKTEEELKRDKAIDSAVSAANHFLIEGNTKGLREYLQHIVRDVPKEDGLRDKVAELIMKEGYDKITKRIESN